MGEENSLIKNKNDYYCVFTFMITDLNLSGSELIVYAIIYKFSSDKVNRFFGSQRYLAEWANMSDRNVRNALNSLIKKGLIIKSEEYKNNVKFVSYQAVFPDSTANQVMPEIAEMSEISGGRKNFPGGADKISANNRDYSTNPLVEDSCIRIRSSIRNINITHTPTTHTPISTAPLGATCQEKPQNDVPQVFEDKDEATFQKFWNAYPDCKRKTNRKACKTALLNVPNLEEELPKILEGLEAWKKDSEWSKEGGQYIPAPLVFIHQRKWEGILKYAEQKKKEDEILKNMFFGDEKIFDDN